MNITIRSIEGISNEYCYSFNKGVHSILSEYKASKPKQDKKQK